MLEGRMLIGYAAAVVLLFGLGAVHAETWRLEKGEQLKAVSAEDEDKYLLEVAGIKQLIQEGKSAEVRKAVDKLKKEFPEIAGADLDAFIKAEILFCEGKLIRAAASYDKFLADYPASELYEAALDREYAIATAFLGGYKKTVLKVFKMSTYDEGEKIMEKIADRLGNAPLAKKALKSVAQSDEQRGRFDEAYYRWSEIESRWPTGETGKEALLGMARCKHAAYRGPRYDVSNLVSAKSFYENFRLRYAEDANRYDVNAKLSEIEEQLAYKHFKIGEYYQHRGNKEPANLYYHLVTEAWPGSSSAKMAQERLKDEYPQKGREYGILGLYFDAWPKVGEQGSKKEDEKR